MSEEQKPELEISVNTEYRNHEVEFIEAYATKRVINILLIDKCKFDEEKISEAQTIFLDFPTRLIVCQMRGNGKWAVAKITNI
jgi:hypothetical protein